MLEAATSKDSIVLRTGNPAASNRVAALEASRAANSASMRTPRVSSGVRGWTFAVARTPSASRRIVASCNRRNPATRSTGSFGAAGACDGGEALLRVLVVIVDVIVPPWLCWLSWTWWGARKLLNGCGGVLLEPGGVEISSFRAGEFQQECAAGRDRCRCGRDRSGAPGLEDTRRREAPGDPRRG
jgi:hypothetical protein